jgi:hypothetical protein
MDQLSFINKIDKKIRYTSQAFLFGGFLTFAYFNISFTTINLFLIGMSLVMIGSIFVHYPNFKLDGLIISLILPVHLLLGAILFLEYFPNLGDVFRFIVILSFTVLYYIVLAADNVFLVVHDREELIPLYRVAVTWSLILIIIIAIPLFSGLFKLPFNPFFHVISATVSAFLFNMYQIWISKYDEDAKDLKIGESILISFMVAFMVLVALITTMFIPTESFLRAIFVASALMFGLNYANSYLKNTTSKTMMAEYFLISLIFLFLLILFTN